MICCGNFLCLVAKKLGSLKAIDQEARMLGSWEVNKALRQRWLGVQNHLKAYLTTQQSPYLRTA